jgi:hypothetical protein
VGRWRSGRVIDVGDQDIHGLAPSEGTQHGGDQCGQIRCRDAPPGTNLNPHPAAADHYAGDLAGGQVRGDLTEPAPVQLGDARARLHRRGDSIHVDTVDDCWPRCVAAR